MTQLKLLDQLFFKLEQTGMSPMYMGGAMILDPSESPFPMDGQVVANHQAALMEEIPLLRQKLVQDKLRLGNLRLVDDPEFDVNSHITVSQLQAPGGYEELTAKLGEFSARRMDLERPLWHYEVIEGLEGGKIAVAFHLHHSVLDGVGASRVLGGMMSTEPVKPREPKEKNWSPDAEPGAARLAGTALLEQARRMYVDTPKFVYSSARPLLKALNKQLSQRLGAKYAEVAEKQGASKPKPRKTSLNSGRISEQRVVAYLNLPMAEIKALRKTYDCSINDLAFVINSVALEHYFENIGEEIDFDLIAAMPMNTRAADDDSVGNSLTAAMVSLHNTEPDIRKRLAAITRETREIKASANRPGNKNETGEPPIDFDALTELFSPMLLDVLGYFVTRWTLFEKLPAIANVAITNVPGPPGELYFGGARVTANIPMAPFGGPVALTITISSTSDIFSIGYHGCGEAIKDKELLVAGAERAFALLKKNARPRRKTAKTKARPRKRQDSE